MAEGITYENLKIAPAGSSSIKSSSPGSSSPSSYNPNNTLEFTHVDCDDTNSTSAILHYCTRAILKPYHVFLAILGWRSLSLSNEDSRVLRIASAFYFAFVALFTLSGYLLQSAACFRRDRGGGFFVVHKLPVSFFGEEMSMLQNKRCEGSVLGLYVFPNIFHLSAYVFTLYLFRISGYEQLHSLIEKAFLQTCQLPNYYSTQPKLMRILRFFVLGCFCWMLISIAAQGLHINSENLTFTWLYKNESSDYVRTLLIVLLLITLILHDLIHVTILWSYGIQCELLISLMRNICDKIRGKMSLQVAIKEINDCYKFLKYLNDEMSISVALLILYSGSLMSSGLVALLTLNEPDVNNNSYLLSATIVSVISWTITFIFPIVQAARLTAACKSICQIGHLIRARPFGYQDALQEDLDSFLLYTSTLNMKGRLFRIPVHAGVVIAILAICVFVAVLLGELNVINLGF